MANQNYNATIYVKNENDINAIYPATKIANVEGLQSALNGKSPTDHVHSTFSASSNGFVPAASASGDSDKFLKGDGTWATPAGGGSGDVSSITVNGTSYTPDANGDVDIGTVARTDTQYSGDGGAISISGTTINHATGTGYRHIPSGGSSGQLLGWLSNGSAQWVDAPSGGGGDVSSVKVGSTSYNPDSEGVVSLPAYPTSLPASDVYSWAKASSKPSYSASEVGAAAESHSHSASDITSGTLGSSRIPTATSSTKGGVYIGNNITVSSGTISLTSSNITNALGYTPLSSHQSLESCVKKAYYTSNKTSGSLNDLSEGRVYCSSNCTNMPVSANMFVETMLDYNGSYKAQRAEVISGSYAGHVFSRYYNSSWSSWIDLTLNVPITLATSGNISSASIDLSGILTGTYLFTVTNNESGTSRYGCSLYVLQKFDSGTIYIMKPVSEITNAKLSSYSFSGNTMSLSFDKSGYKTLRLICLYR